MSRLGRILVPWRLRLAHILYRNPVLQRGVIKLGPWTILKQSHIDRALQEASALTFVRNHTSIPVPTLLDTWNSKEDLGSIRMSMCPGVQLGKAWPVMSTSSRFRTIAELKAYIAQLRALRQPEPAGWVGSTTRGPITCPRISMGGARGPWASGREFHSFLLKPLDPCPNQKLKQKYRNILTTYDHRIVFTHGDLSFENILVDEKTGRVTAIVDWAMAGWWPEYWEYRKSMFGDRSMEVWWVELVEQIMTPWKEEYDIDSDLEMF